jgi:hypothetical protein
VKLYRKINKTQTTKLNEKQLAVVQAINDHDKSASINQLVDITGFKYQTVRNILLGRDGKPGLLSRVPGMKRIEGGTSTTTKTGDGEATTTSDRSDIFELPWNFKMLESYDEGSIELPEGADDIDLSTFTLKHRLNAAFTDDLYKLKTGDLSSKEKTDTLLHYYTTTLHNNTHTYTDNSGHTEEVGVRVNNENTHARAPTVRVSEKSRKSVKVTEPRNEEPEKGDENAWGRSESNIDLIRSDVKTTSLIRKTTFLARLGSLKYTPVRYNDKTAVKEHICREVAEERFRHLDDVRADWDAVCDDPDMVQSIDKVVETND